MRSTWPTFNALWKAFEDSLGDSPEARLAVARGITPEHFTAIQRYRPAIAVVGGFVTGAADPRAAALSIREALSSMT